MEVSHENVKSVSGLFFQVVDITGLMHEPKKSSFIIYLRNGQEKDNLSRLHKFIKMFALPFRMVLLNESDREFIGFILFWDEDDMEELSSTMEWIAVSHPEWVVVDCQNAEGIPKIIGYRIANNLFHAKRLVLQGEVL